MQNQSSNSEASVQCPSFSTYSTNSTAEIAVRVSREFEKLDLNSSGDSVGDEDGEEFEFVSAGDDVFFGGGAAAATIGPVFPVFNRDLIISGDRLAIRGGDEEASGPPSSSSSSEADELDGIPEGTYCVWTPKCVPATPGRCKKSNSTGSTASAASSRRWRFRDLLRRSHSDGKESFVFLTPSVGSSKTVAVEEEQKSTVEKSRRSSAGSDRTVRIGAGKVKDMAAAHEVFYVRNKGLDRTAEKRRSTFLPYRRDLFGFFAGVNTVGRTFPPF